MSTLRTCTKVHGAVRTANAQPAPSASSSSGLASSPAGNVLAGFTPNSRSISACRTAPVSRARARRSAMIGRPEGGGEAGAPGPGRHAGRGVVVRARG